MDVCNAGGVTCVLPTAAELTVPRHRHEASSEAFETIPPGRRSSVKHSFKIPRLGYSKYDFHHHHHHVSRKTSTAGHRPPPKHGG
jgi:hypothetical protein